MTSPIFQGKNFQQRPTVALYLAFGKERRGLVVSAAPGGGPKSEKQKMYRKRKDEEGIEGGGHETRCQLTEKKDEEGIEGWGCKIRGQKMSTHRTSRDEEGIDELIDRKHDSSFRTNTADLAMYC